MTSIAASYANFAHINTLMRRAQQNTSALANAMLHPRMRHTGQTAPKIINIATPLQGGQPINYDQSVADMAFTIEKENVSSEKERLKGESSEKASVSLEFKLSQPVKLTLMKDINSLIKETQYIFSGDISVIKFVDIFQKFNDLSYNYNEYINDIKRDANFALLWHTKLVNLQSIYLSLRKRLTDIMNGQYSMEELRIKTHGNYNLAYIATLINQIISVIEMMLLNKNTSTYLRDNMETPMNDIIKGQVSSEPQAEIVKTQAEIDQEEADRVQAEQDAREAADEEARTKAEQEVRNMKDAERKALEAELRKNAEIQSELDHYIAFEMENGTSREVAEAQIAEQKKEALRRQDYLLKKRFALEAQEAEENDADEERKAEEEARKQAEADAAEEERKRLEQEEIDRETAPTMAELTRRLRQAEDELGILEAEKARIDAKARTTVPLTKIEKRLLTNYAITRAQKVERIRIANQNIADFRAANVPGTAEEAIDKKYMADANYLIRSPSEIAFNNFIRMNLGAYFYTEKSGQLHKLTADQIASLSGDTNHLFKSTMIQFGADKSPTTFYSDFLRTRKNPITKELITHLWNTYNKRIKNKNFVKMAMTGIVDRYKF